MVWAAKRFCKSAEDLWREGIVRVRRGRKIKNHPETLGGGRRSPLGF